MKNKQIVQNASINILYLRLNVSAIQSDSAWNLQIEKNKNLPPTNYCSKKFHFIKCFIKGGFV